MQSQNKAVVAKAKDGRKAQKYEKPLSWQAGYPDKLLAVLQTGFNATHRQHYRQTVLQTVVGRQMIATDNRCYRRQ